MKTLVFVLLISAYILVPAQSLAQKYSDKTDDKAGNQEVQTLSNLKLEQLAKATGEWIHFAAFEIEGQAQHLLCSRDRSQKVPACVVATPKGKVLQETVGFGRFKSAYAVGFRVTSRESDLWLPMLLQGSAPSESTEGGSLWDHYGDAFGHDLSGIKIHTGGGDLSGMLGAKAYAVGSDIAFGGETSGNASLLAHEAAHVITESSGGDNPGGNTDGEDSSNGESSNGDENSGGDSGSSGSGSNGNGSGSGGSGSSD